MVGSVFGAAVYCQVFFCWISWLYFFFLLFFLGMRRKRNKKMCVYAIERIFQPLFSLSINLTPMFRFFTVDVHVNGNKNSFFYLSVDEKKTIIGWLNMPTTVHLVDNWTRRKTKKKPVVVFQHDIKSYWAIYVCIEPFFQIKINFWFFQ